MKKSLTILYTFVSTFLFSQKTYLHCGKLIDVVNGTMLSEMTIIIDGNKIVDIQKGYLSANSPDKKIDLKSKTVLPGLMDAHVHMDSQTNPDNFLHKFTWNPADYAFQSVGFAEKTLMAGFTTVRDLGGLNGGSNVNISLRDAINKRWVIGPRIYTAGKIIATTGGHGDVTNGYNKQLMGDPGPEAGVVNGADECRKAIRQRYKEGSDLVKITASGGVISIAKDGSSPQFNDDELKAIVETAKDYNFTVAAHAHGAEAIKRAVRAGVTSIEHGTYMDEESIQLMKQYGTYYVPTITAGKSVADSAKITGYYNAIVTPKALAIGPKIEGTFAKAYKAGVKIAFGTDAGVFMHGKNWMEFLYMTEGGMPAMEAIQAATITDAKLLRIDNILGSIEKGKLADIIAVDSDPLKDIKEIANVSFVMKDGIIYKNN